MKKRILIYTFLLFSGAAFCQQKEQPQFQIGVKDGKVVLTESVAASTNTIAISSADVNANIADVDKAIADLTARRTFLVQLLAKVQEAEKSTLTPQATTEPIQSPTPKSGGK